MSQIEPLGAGEPRQLGPFRVVGRIGEGGQGIVYLGEDSAGERVAIKLLHVKFSGDASARSRFAREARAAQRVASFCTAGVVHVDLEGDTPYIASEYIEGRSLREVVEADGPIRGAALQRLAVGTATALTAIHHASIVHRDFKPDNVLMAADGPRVVDFGIARIIDSTGTITSRAIGTPAYMAPEQISGDDVGPYTDIFAWGATIAFAATGEMSFAGGSIAVVLNRILNHEVDVSSMPEPLRSVVSAALAKNPAERPSADQLLLRLLGRSDATSVSPAVLTQGAQVAVPEPGDVTNPMRIPQRTGPRPPLPGVPDPHTGVSLPAPTVPDSRTGVPTVPDSHTGAPAGTDRAGTGGTGGTRTGPGSGTPDPSTGVRAPYPTRPDAPAHDWQGGGRFGPPSWETPVPPADPAPPGRSRRAVWAAVAIVVALLGSASAVYATGWRPPFLADPGSTVTPGTESTPPKSASLVDRAAKTKKLTVGMRNFLPGIALRNTDGTWSGFEVDLATEIAKALDVPAANITFRETAREERPGLLASGGVDMVVSTYSINDQDKVTFAGPYYLAHVDVLVKDGAAIGAAADLRGKRLCQPRGSGSTDRVSREVDGDLELVPAENYAQCMDKLRAGEVDAVPGDDLLLAGYANRESTRYEVVGLELTDERYAVALREGDERACKAIQGVIADLYENGTVRQLLDKHFSNVDFTTREDELPAMADCG
ncbi:hypothetical protein GCM10010156_45750 [Planobispora rosea]|uniref:Protein kinase domain-containing protein n=1 Tax=Planobispora rosea TaxID=35762 RepID=A0A8J3S1V5_PLARO|nr:bifunctional serine/threonine-protein kinase/glutamate ABC transporter substrate-binding protein [Planobispora rosea]GGS81869.1 hypothetical protein GCM10010156_45750 [Planobispora rosea]GIH86092.1 hypothetical protein Pro02_45000 [Planobispora rosea]